MSDLRHKLQEANLNAAGTLQRGACSPLAQCWQAKAEFRLHRSPVFGTDQRAQRSAYFQLSLYHQFRLPDAEGYRAPWSAAC